MKTCIITIACVLIVCLLLGGLCYAEFGTVNFIRLGLAMSELTSGDGVYLITDRPEKVWLSGSEEAFREHLESEGYLLRTDEQQDSRIPVEKDGLRDYVVRSNSGMYHKWTWQTSGEPAQAQPDAPEVLYHPKSVTGSAYFYPQTDTAVTAGAGQELTFAYPACYGVWSLTARPDGTLVGESGLTYDSLFWEGTMPSGFSMEEGFCVAGADTGAFLEDALAKLGLSRREAGDLLRRWLPRMEDNAWNRISFHTDVPGLDLSPAPDTHIRVLMLWMPLEEPLELVPQELVSPDRTGFTVVEWYGGEVREP